MLGNLSRIGQRADIPVRGVKDNDRVPLTPQQPIQGSLSRSRREIREQDAGRIVSPVLPDEAVSRRSRREQHSTPVGFPRESSGAATDAVPVSTASRRERRVLESSTVELPSLEAHEIQALELVQELASEPAAIGPAAVGPVAVEPVEPVEPAAEEIQAQPTEIELVIEIVGAGSAEADATLVKRAEPVIPITEASGAAVRIAVASEPEGMRRRRISSLPAVLTSTMMSIARGPVRRPTVFRERSRSIKRAVMSGFIMVVSVGLVASLSLPATGFAAPGDFAAVQNFADAGPSQNLSVTGGTALVANRDDYYAQGAPGSLYSTTNTTVSKVAQSLAVELMAAVAAGRLKGSSPDHIREIQWLANGVAQPNCGIDLRILQVMVLAIRNFDTVAVSDINRRCTGQIEGGGLNSSHYMNGGGHAVDFYELNGRGLYGADANTIKLARILDPLMPTGSDLGQQSCRTSEGIQLNLVNLKEFDDTCTHMHIDVGTASGGLAGNVV